MAGLKAFEVFGEITLKGAKQVQSDLKKSAGEAQTGSKSFMGMSLSGAAVGAALVGAGIAAAKFGADCVMAAAKAEVRTARLKATVAATGQQYDKWKSSIDSTIESQKLASAFSGGELKDGMTTLIRMTGSVTQGQRDLAIATDLARGTGMDLASASKLLGKVENGNVAILKRYGIAVKEGATAEEAMAQIQATVAGQSEAYSQTLQGQIELLKNRWSALTTNLGSKALPMANAVLEEIEIFTRANLTWKERMALRSELIAKEWVERNKITTLAQAQATDEWKWAHQAEKASVVKYLAKRKETGAVKTNTAALIENTDAQEENRNAAYDEERADIAVERAQLRLKDTKKALTEAIKKHGKNSREAKEATLDYRDAVVDAKQADEDLIEKSPGVVKNLKALRRYWQLVADAAAKAAQEAAAALDAQYGRGAGAATAKAGAYGGSGKRHGGGFVDRSGFYALQAGEFVLKASAARMFNQGHNTAPASEPPIFLVDLGNGYQRVATREVQSGQYRGLLAGS